MDCLYLVYIRRDKVEGEVIDIIWTEEILLV